MATSAPSSSGALAISTDEPEFFRCDTHSEDTLKLLQARVDLCDVVLIGGDSGKRISAHSLILIASSDYFSTLLGEPMDESQKREITLSEVDGDALEKVVNYCYTGKLDLEGDTIEALLTTANHLHLEKVVEGCCEFIVRHLKSSNCLAVAFFAERLNIEALLNSARKVVCENFEEVSGNPEFLLLTAKQLSDFIGSDVLNVPSEEFVFRVLMKWIEYEPENRRQHFTDLLAQIRLPLLPPNFLDEKVKPLCNTMESKDMLVETLKSHLLPQNNSMQPRKRVMDP